MATVLDIYSERSHLLAVLARIYPSHAYEPTDAEEGFSHAVCIHFPWGQGSWHLSDGDFEMLFMPWIEIATGDYDGHTTEQKYQSMRWAAMSWESWAFPNYPPVLPDEALVPA